MPSYEMQDLGSRQTNASPSNEQPIKKEVVELHSSEVISLWTWCSALVLSLIAAILVFSPRFLLFLAEESDLTALEKFLALHFGILHFALALALVFNIPEPAEHSQVNHPLLIPLTIASATSAFISYNTPSVRALAVVFFVGHGIIALWGAWVLVFGVSPVAKSSHHGALFRKSARFFRRKELAAGKKKL